MLEAARARDVAGLRAAYADDAVWLAPGGHVLGAVVVEVRRGRIIFAAEG